VFKPVTGAPELTRTELVRSKFSTIPIPDHILYCAFIQTTMLK